MKNRIRWLVAAAMLSAVLLVGCGGQAASDDQGVGAVSGNSDEQAASVTDSIHVVHKLGDTIVPLNPQRVVAFDLGVLDSLDKMGIQVLGLPKATLPEYLAKYEGSEYENLGSLVEPDFEKINAVDPELIIISDRQAEQYKEFSAIAPTIHMGVNYDRYLESFRENTRTLGQIFGLEDRVNTEIAQIDAAITALAHETASNGENALIIMANEGNISVYGPGSRFGIVHDAFGFAPADPDIEVSTHGQSVSFEYLLDIDPDYLFVIDRGAAIGGQASAKSLLENELAANMKAVQNGKVAYLSSDVWYLAGGGLESMTLMVSEVANFVD